MVHCLLENLFSLQADHHEDDQKSLSYLATDMAQANTAYTKSPDDILHAS